MQILAQEHEILNARPKFESPLGACVTEIIHPRQASRRPARLEKASLNRLIRLRFFQPI